MPGFPPPPKGRGKPPETMRLHDINGNSRYNYGDGRKRRDCLLQSIANADFSIARGPSDPALAGGGRATHTKILRYFSIREPLYLGNHVQHALPVIRPLQLSEKTTPLSEKRTPLSEKRTPFSEKTTPLSESWESEIQAHQPVSF